MDGVAFLQCLRMQGLRVPAIVNTGKPSAFVRQQALAAGAIAFLEKLLDAGQIVSLVREGKAAASQEALQLGNALLVAPVLTTIERQFGTRSLAGMVKRPVLLIACPLGEQPVAFSKPFRRRGWRACAGCDQEQCRQRQSTPHHTSSQQSVRTQDGAAGDSSARPEQQPMHPRDAS